MLQRSNLGGGPLLHNGGDNHFRPVWSSLVRRPGSASLSRLRRTKRLRSDTRFKIDTPLYPHVGLANDGERPVLTSVRDT
jgi:hypothetical protein